MRRSVLLAAVLLCLVATVGFHGYSAVRAQTSDTPTVTRAEAAMLLLRQSRRMVPALHSDGAYPDLPDDTWYTRYVLLGVKIGMWNADPGTNNVRPLAPTTRADFLKMLQVVYHLRQYQPYPYIDVHQADPVAPYAGIAATNKLFLTEETPLLLQPNMPLTHAEASAALFTLLKNKPDLAPRQYLLLRKPVYTDITGSRAVVQNDSRNFLTSYITRITPSAVKNALERIILGGTSAADRARIDVLHAINNERLVAGLPALSVNAALQDAAQRHAKDMYERGYFSHFTPEGKSYVDRIKDAGYTNVDAAVCGCTIPESDTSENREEGGPGYVLYTTEACLCRPRIALGENIAKGQLTATEAVRDWMNSPAHRSNILQEAFDETGIGIFGDLWVQTFGRFDLE